VAIVRRCPRGSRHLPSFPTRRSSDLAGFRGEGPAQVKDFMREMLKAEPDLNWRLSIIIESGPIVAAEWTWTATYTGDSPGGLMVAKRISGRGATVAVIENGQIKRFTDYYDTASYFPQTPSGHQ